MANKQTYIAFLRGINVGGNHKVPMAELRKEMGKMGFENVKTLLNSGNVIFDTVSKQETKLEEEIASHLEKFFKFPIPVLIRKSEELIQLIDENPFKKIKVTPDIRLYVSFLKKMPDKKIALPWISEDQSFKIIDIRDKTLCSVLDLSFTKTPKGMDSLEQLFGKNITTRNLNTLNKIINNLS